MKPLFFIMISMILFSCDDSVKINERISIQKWNDEGYSLNYNHDGNWLGVVLPTITKYDKQGNYLLLEREVLNNEIEYYIINLDSLNYPKSLEKEYLTKEEFIFKTDSLAITYSFKSLR